MKIIQKHFGSRVCFNTFDGLFGFTLKLIPVFLSLLSKASVKKGKLTQSCSNLERHHLTWGPENIFVKKNVHAAILKNSERACHMHFENKIK